MMSSRSFDRREFGERPLPLFRAAFFVLVVTALHSLLFRRLRIAGFGPDFFLAATLIGGLELGMAGGAAVGVMAGLAADMCTFRPVGLWTFVCGVTGMVSGMVSDRAFTGSLRRPPLLLVALGTAMGTVLYPALALLVSNASYGGVPRLLLGTVVISLWSIPFVLPLRWLVRTLVGRRA